MFAVPLDGLGESGLEVACEAPAEGGEPVDIDGVATVVTESVGDRLDVRLVASAELDEPVGDLTVGDLVVGADVVDLTDFAVFERGSLWHTGVLAVGGDHFTNDIAVGLRMPIPDAEKLKRRSGCALTSMVAEDDTMDVASMAGRRSRVMPRRVLWSPSSTPRTR